MRRSNISLINSFVLAADATNNFTIIDNDGSRRGDRASLPGSPRARSLTIGDGLFVITYHGGDGNDVVLLAANNLPTLSGLGDTPSYTENGAAAVLDADHNSAVSDAELNTFETFAGATLTLARHGGVNPDDIFSGSGTLDLAHSNGSARTSRSMTA